MINRGHHTGRHDDIFVCRPLRANYCHQKTMADRCIPAEKTNRKPQCLGMQCVFFMFSSTHAVSLTTRGVWGITMIIRIGKWKCPDTFEHRKTPTTTDRNCTGPILALLGENMACTAGVVLLFFLVLIRITTGQGDFTHEVQLDGANDFWLRWSFSADAIDVEASAKTLGWLAFGFSQDGGMDKSDVLFGFINSTSGRANISVCNRKIFFFHLWYFLFQGETLLSKPINHKGLILDLNEKKRTL